MNRIYKLLIASLLAVLSTWTAEASSTESITICEKPEIVCTFPDGIDFGLNEWLRKNLHYPLEAWAAVRSARVPAEFVISEDGKVIDHKFLIGVHPLLETELNRVIKKMNWVPAYNKGERVNTRVSIILELVPISPREERIPFGLEYVMRDGEKAYNKLKKSTRPYNNGDQKLYDNIKDINLLEPDLAKYTLGYAGICAARGDGKMAMNVMEKCWNNYAINPALDPVYRRIPMVRGYNGRTELWLGVSRVMHRMHAAAENTDTAFQEVLDVINARIIDRELMDKPFGRDYVEKAEKRVEQMKRDMVNEWVRLPLTDRNTPTWGKITRNYNVDELTSGLRYWAERGEIDNAQIVQLKNLIKQEYNAMTHGKNASSKDILNIFRTKALVIWLQNGKQGLHNFISSIKDCDEASDKLVKYLDNLNNQYARNAALLEDRDKVIESLVCMVPPEGTDAAGVQAFYDRRKAVEDVFPIKWLSK